MSNRFCGSQEQRSKIAAQREKEKARVKRKKEKARNSKQTKAAMREAQGREDDIATEDTSKHSELQPSPLPAALDMRIDMSTSSARESVLILPDRLPAQEVVAQGQKVHWSSSDLVLGMRTVGFFSPPQQGPIHRVQLPVLRTEARSVPRKEGRGVGGDSVSQTEENLAL